MLLKVNPVVWRNKAEKAYDNIVKHMNFSKIKKKSFFGFSFLVRKWKKEELQNEVDDIQLIWRSLTRQDILEVWLTDEEINIIDYWYNKC